MTNEIKIIPLGSISPYCKNESNCPGFLVKYHDENILLDCGNGITRLLNMPADLNNLSIIISHYHKDHIGDLGILQYASYVYHKLGMLDKKINIYLPENDYLNTKQSIINVPESYSNFYDINDDLKYKVAGLDISFHDNKSHSINTYVTKIENGCFKIVYTSDIGNTNLQELISFIKNADLLICESTYLKEYNVNDNHHLTAYEAGMIAKEANVKQLMLMHFWPEEEKSKYLKEAKEIFPNTIVAEEIQTITLKRRR